MASKTLKSVKTQNKELKSAVKSQKQDEAQAKLDLQKAKSEAGIFGSKEQRQAVKQAKLKYKQEKMETQYGKELQSQGKDMQKIVSSDSRKMGVFHSDKKLSAPVKQSVAQHTSNVKSFVASNGGDATKADVKSQSKDSAVLKAADTAKKGILSRALPKVNDSIQKVVEKGLGVELE